MSVLRNIEIGNMQEKETVLCYSARVDISLTLTDTNSKTILGLFS